MNDRTVLNIFIELYGVALVIVIVWIKPSSFSKDNLIEVREISAI